MLKKIGTFLKDTSWTIGLAGWGCFLYNFVKDWPFYWRWASICFVIFALFRTINAEITGKSLNEFKLFSFAFSPPEGTTEGRIFAGSLCWFLLIMSFAEMLPQYWSELFPLFAICAVHYWKNRAKQKSENQREEVGSIEEENC